jgi:hypothetical protein
MITDAQLELMTAAIDGELSPAETRRLARLLDSSPEARAIYTRLKADSARLHKLPPISPPANLHKRIMARVAGLTPKPVRQPQPRTAKAAELTQPEQPVPATAPLARKPGKRISHRIPRWAPVAIAAALLICVTASSFWLFTKPSGTTGTAGHMPRNPKRPPPATLNGADDPAWANWLPSDTSPRPAIPTPRERGDANVFVSHDPLPQLDPRPPIVDQDVVAIAPAPRTMQNDAFGSPLTIPLTRFNLVDIRIPFLKTVAEFDQSQVRKELVDELKLDPAFRIDLFARDTIRGVEVFQTAARTGGLTVLADATTMERLKKRQITSVVIYTEAFSAEELAELFGKLCSEDAKISPHVFDVLHATTVTTGGAGDVANLRSVLGIDPGLFKRPGTEKGDKGEKSDKLDPTKPLSAGTADHIVKSVTKPAEKVAVLATWEPAAGRTPHNTSAEIKQFIAKRGDRKSNAVPVLIVIRPGNG